MENKTKEQPREYTMTFEDGKTVLKTTEELTPAQVYACEKLNENNFAAKMKTTAQISIFWIRFQTSFRNLKGTCKNS
mgnify:CR=1 FL=1